MNGNPDPLFIPNGEIFHPISNREWHKISCHLIHYFICFFRIIKKEEEEKKILYTVGDHPNQWNGGIFKNC